MENFKFGVEKKEKPKKLLGTLTFVRHSKTKYTEEYPDWTPEGEEIAHERASELADRSEKSEQKKYYVSSPLPRALGVSDVVKERMGDKDRPTHRSNQIRCADFKDREEVNKWFADIVGSNPDDPKAAERAYTKDERFQNRPDIIEPQEKIKARAMRALYHLVRTFKMNKDDKPPHVIATSHFEIINPIINEIFPDEDIFFGYVEDVEIDFYEIEDSKSVMMKVRFRGMEKEVEFDRDKREIIV